MSFIDELKDKAKQNIKTIILTESEDKRVLKAAEDVMKEGFAKIILIGNKDDAEKLAKENNIDLSGIEIIDPETSDKFDEYANAFYELRKAKGITPEDARKIVKDNMYFGTMMVKQGDADGLVSGACHSTANTLRSAFFLMVVPDGEYGEHGIFVFGDSGLVENPTADQLSEIAISSSKSFEQLTGKESKVALLSYSTYGSAHSELTEKVVEATKLLKEKAPDLVCDGELQLDAAIVPEVAASKAPGSSIKGEANTLIFPDLNAGNIGYKLVQRLGKAEAYGPLCQGIARPVNDLSRGCSSDDIVGVVAITSVQASSMD